MADESGMMEKRTGAGGDGREDETNLRVFINDKKKRKKKSVLKRDKINCGVF